MSYDERISCLQRLAQLQKDISHIDEHYINVSSMEGKPHTSAWNTLEALNKQYKELYTKCEKILKH